jgi:tetratricopeptide (TPR) repeat protein
MVVQGEYSQALTVLQHAAPQESHQETTRRMLLAQCFAFTGNNEAALREATWCREQGVVGPELHAFLAQLFITLGDRGSALVEAERALKEAPTNTANMMVLADLLVDPEDGTSANTQRSARLVAEVLKRDGTNARAWFAQAVIHSRRKEWDASIRAYERCLALEPNNVDAKAQLANVLVHQKGEAQRGLQLVEEVIMTTDSMHVQALELAAHIRVHTALADGHTATRLLRRVERLQQSDRTALLLTQGQAALLSGDNQGALTALEACWALDSLNVRVAEAYALALMRNGRFAEGVQVAHRGLSIDPLHSRLNVLLGEASIIGPAALYDAVKGEQYLTTALRTDMHDPFVLNLCGETRLRLGNKDGAASVINAAYRLAPNDHRSNRNMGNVEEARNDLKAAARYYRRALELDGTDNATASNLAFVLLKMGRGFEQEGLHWSQRSVDLARSPENLLIHARLLFANKRKAEAAQVYREAVKDRPDIRQADLEAAFKDMP